MRTSVGGGTVWRDVTDVLRHFADVELRLPELGWVLQLLQVLVGKTLEQSMMEVLEEEELASLQRRSPNKKKNVFYQHNLVHITYNLHTMILFKSILKHELHSIKAVPRKLVAFPKLCIAVVFVATAAVAPSLFWRLRHQEDFEKRRNAELLEVGRLVRDVTRCLTLATTWAIWVSTWALRFITSCIMLTFRMCNEIG